jgi:hypothetical protein
VIPNWFCNVESDFLLCRHFVAITAVCPLLGMGTKDARKALELIR